MQRVKLRNTDAKFFFESIKRKTGYSNIDLAKKCGVHRRTIFDWSRGKYSIPLNIFQKLIIISDVEKPFINLLPQYWYVKKAGEKGALERYKRYGNLGTSAGRSKGGKATYRKMASLQVHPNQSKFCLRQPIRWPEYSERLAEFMGIFLGDGGMSSSQVSITLNKFDDFEFSLFVKKLIYDLFDIEVSVYERRTFVHLVASRKGLVEFLLSQGFKIENKVHYQIEVPEWIKTDDKFIKRVLEGAV